MVIELPGPNFGAKLGFFRERTRGVESGMKKEKDRGVDMVLTRP